jgi:hypothetical protein
VSDCLPRRTVIFIVRVWAEYLEQTPPVWRGEIEHVESKEVMRFHTLDEVTDHVQLKVAEQLGGIKKEAL